MAFASPRLRAYIPHMYTAVLPLYRIADIRIHLQHRPARPKIPVSEQFGSAILENVIRPGAVRLVPEMGEKKLLDKSKYAGVKSSLSLNVLSIANENGRACVCRRDTQGAQDVVSVRRSCATFSAPAEETTFVCCRLRLLFCCYALLTSSFVLYSRVIGQ